MFRNKILAILLILFIVFSSSSCTSFNKSDKSANKDLKIEKPNKIINVENSKPTETAQEIEKGNFVGKWNRTNIIKAWAAEIKINDQKEDSFQFSFARIHDKNRETIAGTAYLESENVANFDYTHEIENEEHPIKEKLKVQFVLENDVLDVKVFAEDGSELNFGNNEFIDGEYTNSVPVYENENIVDEVLPTEEIKDKMIELLGDEAYEQMLFVMEYGIDSGTITYSGFENDTKQGVDLLIDGDQIYCLLYSEKEGYVFYTNDEEYQDSLPIKLKFSHGDDFKAKYVYKSL